MEFVLPDEVKELEGFRSLETLKKLKKGKPF